MLMVQSSSLPALAKNARTGHPRLGDIKAGPPARGQPWSNESYNKREVGEFRQYKH